MKNTIATMFWIEKNLIYKQRWSILLSHLVLCAICAMLNIFAAKYSISLTLASCAVLVYVSLLFTALASQGALRESREDGAMQTLLTTPLNPVLIYLARVMRLFFVCSSLFFLIFFVQRVLDPIIASRTKVIISNFHISECFYILVIVTVCSLAYLALSVLFAVLFPSSSQLQGIGGVVSFFVVLTGATLICNYFSYQNIFMIALALCTMSIAIVLIAVFIVSVAYRFDVVRL